MAGKYFEELEVGMVLKHGLGRTVTEMDNVLFTALTHNPQPLHLDAEFAKEHSEFGQRLVNSLFTLGLVIGSRSWEGAPVVAALLATGVVYGGYRWINRRAIARKTQA